MVKKILIIILFVVIVVAVVNDVGRWVITWYKLDEVTRATAELASTAEGNRDSVAATAAEFAATQDATLYAYDDDGDKVYVWTEAPLRDTWFLGSVLLVVQGGGLSDDYKLRDTSERRKR